MAVKEAAPSHSKRFGDVGQMKQCRCKSPEQTGGSKRWSCGRGLGDHRASLPGEQAAGEAKGLEEAFIAVAAGNKVGREGL